MEENVPTGPSIGGFPTFRTAPLSNILEITAADGLMQEEISERILTIVRANEERKVESRRLARKFAEDGASVSEAVRLASEETGEHPILIQMEFHRRELHKDLARSRWPLAAPASGDGD